MRNFLGDLAVGGTGQWLVASAGRPLLAQKNGRDHRACA